MYKVVERVTADKRFLMLINWLENKAFIIAVIFKE